MSDYATIYISDPSMMGSRVFNKVIGAGHYADISKNGSATGVRFSWEGRTITMNFGQSDELTAQLKGLEGWVTSVLDDRDQLIYVLARIRYVRMEIGCVVEPCFDSGGESHEFLLTITGHLNGLILLANTLWDFDSEPIAGFHYDAMKLEENNK